ncbi:hypothetical protein [Paraflavitalea sp. CAU 1676]|uniref:hypothetical protein n=1 Tax=Paraflavitalea sp. CAU 1676 TaxID=3032598 RepID=UPI0023DBD01B|nr:hypothetical protein [Paraflavitalea sp. CAU 1676]MDF2192777.1 hypothetical protein [Paraflavitalea sp. CAU 1676]
MNTIQHSKPEFDKHGIWNLSYVLVTAGLFLFLLSVSEFYLVAFSDAGNAYPWGPINENPWYYRTSTTYSAYQFICAFLSLTLSVVTLRATIRKNQPLTVKGLVTIACFFLASLVSANIQ